VLVVCGIALANTTLALQRAFIPSPSTLDTAVSMTMGCAGIVATWIGINAGEPRGSLLGYVGGALIWMGFFEWSWMFFSASLGIDPLIVNGVPMLPPSLLLVQASVFIFLPMCVLIAANKDTRCRMMLWVRRRLRLPIGTATAAYRPQPARVAAVETIFVIWFIYLLNISLYDPRLLGQSAVATLVVVGVLVWAVYLIRRLMRISDAGLAIRYAIPTAYLVSVPVDALAMRGFYPAVWVQPLDYPLAAVGFVAAFAVAARLLVKTR